MTSDLQDRRAKLLAELEKLDEKIAQSEVSDLIDRASNHVFEARQCLRDAYEKDVIAKRERSEQERQQLAVKRAQLTKQIEVAESMYRSAVQDGLRSIALVNPQYVLTPSEQAIIASDAPIVGQIREHTWVCIPDAHSGRISAARRTLSSARRELAALERA